jgi:superfamily II DNA/RNA helicase
MIYDKFEKNLVVFLEENFIKATVPAVKRTRLRQMSLGEVSVDPETDEVYFADDMKSSKLDALLDVVAEYPDEKMLVFMRSQKFARVVAKRMRDAGHRAEEWSGAVSEDERHRIKARFVNGDTDYIVATVASIGEGTDGLQAAARMMVWLERDDNNMLNEQAFRRLYRRGQTRQVISLDIVARNTYDKNQLSNLIQQTLARNKSLRKDKT